MTGGGGLKRRENKQMRKWRRSYFGEEGRIQATNVP